MKRYKITYEIEKKVGLFNLETITEQKHQHIYAKDKHIAQMIFENRNKNKVIKVEEDLKESL